MNVPEALDEEVSYRSNATGVLDLSKGTSFHFHDHLRLLIDFSLPISTLDRPIP